jgi:hypothetical protein
MPRIHWVARGTGIPKDRDEVNRREVCECYEWVCDLDVMGAPSKFSVIRKAAALARARPKGSPWHPPSLGVISTVITWFYWNSVFDLWRYHTVPHFHVVTVCSVFDPQSPARCQPYKFTVTLARMRPSFNKQQLLSLTDPGAPWQRQIRRNRETSPTFLSIARVSVRVISTLHMTSLN